MADSFNLVVKPSREAGAQNIIELAPTMLTRLRASARTLFGRNDQPWFGPLNPVTPVAPADTAGRAFDYASGANLNYSPKQQEGVTFGTMRTLAQSWDLLRLIIETRKDQVCSMTWGIAYRDKSKKADDRTKKIQAWFQMPDKEHTWEEWLRILLEDLLVIDAPTLYPRLAVDGGLLALEPVDGATINRLIDERGRTPWYPAPAYQQILKGLPATEYNRDQLIYRPRNPRSNKVYGYSPVEQLLVTINIALRRQASQLQYYTDGSTPDLILSVPEGWSPEQVIKFKTWWDSILAGNTAGRRGTMFVYSGTDVVDTKEKLLTDKMDEWLARVVCYCFSVSPMPFISAYTRAGAQTAATQAKEEGLGPALSWVENLMGYVLTKYFDAADLRFMWNPTEDVDALTKAQVWNLKTRAGAATINEWRAADGQEPVAHGDTPLVYTPSGAVPLEMAEAGEVTGAPAPGTGDGGDGSGAGKPGGPSATPKGATGAKPAATKPATPKGRNANGKTGPKLAKAKGAERPVTELEVGLSQTIAPILRKMGTQTLADLVTAGITVQGPGKNLQRADEVLAQVDLSAAEKALSPMTDALIKQGEESFLNALVEAGVESDDLIDLANPRAVAYAGTHAATLVADIQESTRTLIRGTVSAAIDGGWSVDELAKALSTEYAFSAQRAATIAATELNDAMTNAALEAWKESGVVKGKAWLVSNTEGVCAVCEANEAEGVIPLDAEFQSGDDGPPAHPSCRCSIIPASLEE